MPVQFLTAMIAPLHGDTACFLLLGFTYLTDHILNHHN